MMTRRPQTRTRLKAPPEEQSAAAARLRTTWPCWPLLAEPVLVLALVVLALVVRLPYLWDMPRFTDETAEAEVGLRIARGELFPLTNVDPYIGSLWNWLLAATYRIGGPSLFSARVVIAVLGALTVAPTYLLGRSVTGSWVLGGLAGLWLALSPAHIVVNSHIAWSNCLTPLFTTFGVWLTHRALQQERPRGLVLGGLCFGLGVQTHPVGVLLLPGVAAAVAVSRPRWLLGRWPWLAVLAAMLAAANLLLANVMGGLDGLTQGGEVQARYTGGEILTFSVYLDRLRQTIWLLSDSLSGAISELGPLVGPFDARLGLVLLALAAAGLEGLARRRDSLLFLAVVSYLLLLPVVNGRYASSVPKARYVAPLVPLYYAAMVAMVLEVYGWIDRRLDMGGVGSTARRPDLPRALVRSGFGAVVFALVLAPLSGAIDYYTNSLQAGRTNAAYYRLVNGILSVRKPGERVYVERNAALTYTIGGGQWREHIIFAGRVYGWEVQTLVVPRPEVGVVPRVVGPLVARASSLPQVAALFRIDNVSGGPTEGTLLRLVYSMGPRPGLLAAGRQDARDDIPQPPRPPRVEVFVAGLSYPSALQFAPDGRLFFNEVREGRVRIASPDGQLQAEPFVVLPTTKGLDQGALGLALDPAFARNHWVYVFYSEANAENEPIRNRLVRFTERDGRATEPTPILDDLPINDTSYFDGDHNGGRIGFGRDGMLYVSLGDMAQRSQVADHSTQFGKILRVAPNGSIPATNPWPGSATYALGFRNVTGIAFHPRTGLLVAADSGEEGFDELNLVRPGHDYGYPQIPGGPAGIAGLDDPFWDSAEESIGISGLTFSMGWTFPEYRGDLFFCASETGALRRVRLSGPLGDQVEWVETISHDCRLDVADGPDGTLYFSDLERIFRLAR